jgi:hypothetical protein
MTLNDTDFGRRQAPNALLVSSVLEAVNSYSLEKPPVTVDLLLVLLLWSSAKNTSTRSGLGSPSSRKSAAQAHVSRHSERLACCPNRSTLPSTMPLTHQIVRSHAVWCTRRHEQSG